MSIPFEGLVSQSPLIGAFVPGYSWAIALNNFMKSQSPLIGAFVPGLSTAFMGLTTYQVSIPSDRGIRSGCKDVAVLSLQRDDVSIPSDRGIRSGKIAVHYNFKPVQVSIPSDRGIRSGQNFHLINVLKILCLNPL